MDADPRIIALFTAHGTATAALQTAKGSLSITTDAVGGLADVATTLANAALGGILDVRSATFEASLAAASGGRVSLDVSLVFLDTPHRLQLAIDFDDPLAAAKRLAADLLAGI
ncbi:MAG: hypothetical protein R2715_04890 [Ilumatobacteraceae bacterium]